jgi:predicted restriction endonuclease
MNNLEKFLDEYDNKELSKDIYQEYAIFGYNDEELYRYHLDFMLNNLYNIKIIEPKRRRLNQTEFRKNIIEKYGKCIITGITCTDELAAAHIVPISNEENYDIDNGLLLTESIHKTFDKFKWTINPDTMRIEINNNFDVGTIKKYEGNNIEINISSELKNNLRWHYNMFLEKIDT